MKSRCFDWTREKGGFIPFVAVMAVALFLLMGLALESANLYFARLRLQRSADAAAVLGARMIRKGDTPAQAAVKADRLFKSNLEEMGYRGSLIATPQITPSASEVHVQGSFQPKLWLLGSILGGGSARTVSVAAKSKISPVIISIVLDVSGSMNCPSTGSCTSCNANPYLGPTCPSPTRIDRARDALDALTKEFRETSDSIALIQTHFQASVLEPMVPTGGFNRASLQAKIAAIAQPGGGSNIQEGVELGIQEILNYASPPADALKVLIVITDGGANGSRLRLLPASVDKLPTNTTARATYDYYMWQQAGAWYLPQLSGLAPTRRPILSYTSMFAPAPQIEPDFDHRNDTQHRDDDLATVTSCGEVFPLAGVNHTLYGSLGYCFWTSTSGLPSATALDTLPDCPFLHLASGLGRQCVNDIRMEKPGSPGVQVGNTMPLTLRGTSQVHYYSTIAESDYARDNGILVYTIGTGVPGADTSTDPFQNVYAGDIKTFLLRRMAADPAGTGDPVFPGFPMPANNPDLAGKFFNAPDSDQLKAAVLKISEQIKYRLTE